MHIAVIPGDGIGPEVTEALVRHSDGGHPMHTTRFGDLVIDLLQSA